MTTFYFDLDVTFVSQEIGLLKLQFNHLLSHRVNTTCRHRLAQCGIVRLSDAPCLQAFIEKLPQILLEQHTYEKVLTVLSTPY